MVILEIFDSKNKITHYSINQQLTSNREPAT